jgi:hypothetical protein
LCDGVVIERYRQMVYNHWTQPVENRHHQHHLINDSTGPYKALESRWLLGISMAAFDSDWLCPTAVKGHLAMSHVFGLMVSNVPRLSGLAVSSGS